MMLRRLNLLIEPLQLVLQNSFRCSPKVCSYSSLSDTTENTDSQLQESKKNISKAMKAYLERAQEHDEFMKQQSLEFQIGKRHLANMMGENPETFTQEDVNNAIEYLFPSGLYEKKARPMMLPPEIIFPKRKAAEFDETGRPHHFLFYTGRPNFHKLLYDVVEHINNLYKFEDSQIRKGASPDPNLSLEDSGYQWMDKESLEKVLVEQITDREYDNFINAMERLCSLPYAYRVKDFIFTYKKPLMSQTKMMDVVKLQYDKEGRSYITTYECLRKRARGHVTVRSPGTGKITINGEDISYFKETQSREQDFELHGWLTLEFPRIRGWPWYNYSFQVEGDLTIYYVKYNNSA